MTKPDTAAIRARLAAATPGEWELWDGSSWRRFGVRHPYAMVIEPYVSRSDGHPDLIVSKEDADLILSAKSDISTLLAENEALEKRIAELEAALRPFAEFADAMGKRLGADTDASVPVYYNNGEKIAVCVGDVQRARAALTPTSVRSTESPALSSDQGAEG